MSLTVKIINGKKHTHKNTLKTMIDGTEKHRCEIGFVKMLIFPKSLHTKISLVPTRKCLDKSSMSTSSFKCRLTSWCSHQPIPAFDQQHKTQHKTTATVSFTWEKSSAENRMFKRLCNYYLQDWKMGQSANPFQTAILSLWGHNSVNTVL